MRWHAGWPGCSPPTPGSVRSCWSTGWTAKHRRRSRRRPGLAARAVARTGRPRSPPIPRTSGMQKTVARLRAGPERPTARLSLFGHTRLACTDIELLDALATHHELHLWLPHPSDDLWRALVEHARDTPRRRRHQPSQSRPSAAGDTGPGPARTTTCAAGEPGDRRIPRRCNQTRYPARLAAVRHRRQRACGQQGRSLAPDDRSVQVHSCHGRPGRSTCCARCCSACSPTTRRWSRATSW